MTWRTNPDVCVDAGFYHLTVLQIFLTADQFQKLSKAYSILTDPAAKVADIAQLLHKIIVHVLVIAGCI